MLGAVAYCNNKVKLLIFHALVAYRLWTTWLSSSKIR